MSNLSLNSFVGIFNNIMEEFLVAAGHDLSDPGVQKELRRRIDLYVSNILGIDVSLPLVKPFWDKFSSGMYEEMMNFIGFTVSSPPKSVDVAQEYLKEKVSSLSDTTSKKIDNIADELKRRLAEKHGE